MQKEFFVSLSQFQKAQNVEFWEGHNSCLKNSTLLSISGISTAATRIYLFDMQVVEYLKADNKSALLFVKK